MGQHHTLMISVGEPLTVIKPAWKPQHFDRIKRAIEMSEKPSMFFVAIEDTDAVIATAREYGLKEFATITRNPGGKMYESKSNEVEFLDEVVQKLVMVMHGEPLIVLGPGFVKEALAKRIREKAPGISSSMVIHHTGQAGMAGINELMKQGVGGKVLDETRVARETRLMEQLFSEIGKNGMYAYGDESVKSAVEAGAVSVLLMLDTKVRSSAADRLIRTVEESKGEFVIVSSMHEAGRRLDSLGGVAALLRYRLF
jgi:protein pelota